jgi:alkylhydroperoxidase family enzyme
MTRVRTISPKDADGDVLAAYQRMTGQEQPEFVGNIFEAISIRPRQMESLMDLTMAVNRANEDSGLSALQRWMIGTVASVANQCRY